MIQEFTTFFLILFAAPFVLSAMISPFAFIYFWWKGRRPCTCHPDDNPPRPCPRKYAYSECVKEKRR